MSRYETKLMQDHETLLGLLAAVVVVTVLGLLANLLFVMTNVDEHFTSQLRNADVLRYLP